ncbi:MAG: hypothetical protein WCH34_07545 [Bacteroidota bacterium]
MKKIETFTKKKLYPMQDNETRQLNPEKLLPLVGNFKLLKPNNIITLILLFLMTISFNINAQPKHQIKKKQIKTEHKVVAFIGKFDSWVFNNDYVYDGFYLQSGEDKFLVKFPKHMGYQLTTVIKPGSIITVSGIRTTDTLNKKEINLVSVYTEDRNISDSLSREAVIKPKSESISGMSKIIELQKNKSHKIFGYVLENKTILRISPKIAHQLHKLATVGTDITYSGIKTSLNQGEVAVNDYFVVHCKSITINSKQYVSK